MIYCAEIECPDNTTGDHHGCCTNCRHVSACGDACRYVETIQDGFCEHNLKNQEGDKS